jgi:hypothetical protein
MHIRPVVENGTGKSPKEQDLLVLLNLALAARFMHEVGVEFLVKSIKARA